MSMHRQSRNGRKVAVLVAAIVGVLTVALAGPTIAGNLIGSPGIKDNSLRSQDYRDGSVHSPDLADRLENRINVGRITRLEADGPYPGATQLGDIEGNQGSNSAELVPADGEVHTVWVKCPTGKTALSGGFSLAADAGTAAAKAVQVTASYPTGAAIEGDAAGSLSTDGWAVDAINTGDAPRVVRPWVVCARVTG